MTRTLTLIPLLLLALASCSPAAAVPTATAFIPSTEMPIPSLTPEPSPTTPPATPTPLPPEFTDLIKHIYLTILMTQVDAQLVSEAANRALSGELSGTDQFATTLVIASLIEAVDETLTADQPPEALLGPWEDAHSIHEQTKQYLSAWFNSEADAAATVASMQAVLAQAETVMVEVDSIFADQYGYDLEELAAQRQETLDSIPDIFPTPTPTASS